MLALISKHRLVREQGPLLALISAIFVIFILQTAFGLEGYRNLMTVPAEIIESWRNLLAGDTSLSNLRPFTTLLTSAFLHGSFEHILFNMIFLWIFAALAVELLGNRWMLIIFVVTAICGSIGHTVLSGEDFVPMLGASGAVMGFMGAYLGLAVRWQLPDPHVWPMSRPIPPAHLAGLAVVGIALDVMGTMNLEQTGIAYGAHIGGFLGGLFLTSFVVRRLARPTRA